MDRNTEPAVGRPQDRKTSSARIETVANATFRPQVLEGEGPIAVEFMSYSCSHCGAIEPVLREVTQLLDGRVRVFRVNVVRDPELAMRYRIEGTPTFLLFRDGQIVERVEGIEPEVPVLLAAITQPFET